MSHQTDEATYCDDCRKISDANNMQTCSACHRAYYCNAICQKTAWKNHKPVCKVLREIKESKNAQEPNYASILEGARKLQDFGYVNDALNMYDYLYDKIATLQVSTLQSDSVNDLKNELAKNKSFLLATLGESEQALNLLDSCVHSTRSSSQEHSVELMELLAKRAVLLSDLGRDVEATACATEADLLRITRKDRASFDSQESYNRYCENTKRIAPIISNAWGRALLRKILSSAGDDDSSSSLAVLSVSNSTTMDKLDMKAGGLGLSLTYQIQAFDMQKKLDHGKGSMEYAFIGVDIGDSLVLLTRYHEAFDYYIESLEVMRKFSVNRDNNVSVGKCLLSLGRAYLHVHNLDMAIDSFSKSEAIFRTVFESTKYGKNSKILNAAKNELAKTQLLKRFLTNLP